MGYRPRSESMTPGRSINFRLVLLVLSILLPAVLLVAGLIWRIGHLDRIRADQQALQLARGVAADLDREIDGWIESLLALASSPSLLRGDLEQFHRQASEALRYRQLHALVRTSDGQQIMNTRVPFGTVLPSSPLSEVEREVIVKRWPRISNLVIGGVTRAWVLGLSVPVIRDDKIAYVITMSIDPEYIRRIISQSPRDRDWIIAVSDPSGRLIARSEDHAVYLGRIIHPDVKGWSVPPEGVHHTPALNGEMVLRGYRWSSKADWLVAAFVPARVIDAPLIDLWRILAFIAFGLTAASVPLVYQLGRQISVPIKAAAIDAHRLGEGLPIVAQASSLREANELSAALASASSALRERTRALAQNEARFRSVFEQSAVGFEQVALDGRFMGVNERLCKMLGYTRDECLNKTFKTLTHPDDWTAEEGLIASLMKNELPHYELEKRLIAKDGTPKWVRVTSSMVRDEYGEPMHRISVIEDVTERRRAREATARLGAIVQASQDAMISATLDGIIETWNPGAESLFGYRESEVVGQSLGILVPGDRKHELRVKLSTAAQGKILKNETVRLHKDGTPIDVTSTASPIITANGAVTSLSVTMEDIRERKGREAQVLLLNRELAHRVKNTLAVIQSIASQTLRSTPAPEDFRIAFQGRLQALAAANDLLIQTNWQGSALSDFVSRQLAPLMPRTPRKLVKTGPVVRLPPDFLIPIGLALHELGTNAVKYGAWSNETGQVQVTWSIERPGEGRRLVLTWTETGGPAVIPPARKGFGTTIIERGIPNATIERTFEPRGVVCRIDIPLV